MDEAIASGVPNPVSSVSKPQEQTVYSQPLRATLSMRAAKSTAVTNVRYGVLDSQPQPRRLQLRGSTSLFRIRRAALHHARW
jgi:hypothetical protein